MFNKLAIIASILWMFGCTSAADDGGGELYGDQNEPGTGTGDGDSGDDGGPSTADTPPADEPLPTPLRTISVDNVPALRDAVATAEPGDLIELHDQVWQLATGIAITRSGTAEHPIVISAETVGGARIEGAAGFLPSGVSHVVIRGFDFRFSAGARAMPCKDCSYVRFTRNHFELAPIDYSHWLVIGGVSHHNRIDRNVFMNKSTNGNFITIDGTSTAVATNNRIELNYFANQTWGGTNEGECIRVGWSGLKFSKGYNVIERNLFEHCDGDPEVVSVKSSNNQIRFNTFRSNDGSLVFRHGHQSEAVGNFFFDNNGGIRVYGDDHRILNNYFESNRGSGSRTPIVIGSGTALDDTPTSSSGYDASERDVIAFNTLVNNASQIEIGNSSTDAIGAIDCTIADNLLVGEGTFARAVRSFTGFTWSANLVSGTASNGELPETGAIRTQDPRLVTSGGFMHLASDSPARDAAVGSYVSDDIDGSPRTDSYDIGADEYSAEPSTRRPLLRDDVGPAAP